MHYEELDAATREYMVREFELEEVSGRPCRSARLSPQGLVDWPRLLRQSLESGDDRTLAADLSDPDLFHRTEIAHRQGRPYEKRINAWAAAEALALTEFNTFYVRGLCARLLAEDVEWCQAYRAGEPKWSTGQCSIHEERLFLVREIYDGHRVAYWPPPGRPGVLSIPCHPNCHHTIRRALDADSIHVAQTERARGL